jgi:hypothetical protein
MMTAQPLSLNRACTGVGLFCFMALAYYLLLDSPYVSSNLPALWKGNQSHPSLWKAKKEPSNEVDAHKKKCAKKRHDNDLLFNSSATSVSTVHPTELPTESPTAVPTSGRTSSPTKTGPANNVDACAISMAIELNPLHVASYGGRAVTIPNSRIPHVSSALCSATAKGSHTSEEWFFVNTTEPNQSCICIQSSTGRLNILHSGYYKYYEENEATDFNVLGAPDWGLWQTIGELPGGCIEYPADPEMPGTH